MANTAAFEWVFDCGDDAGMVSVGEDSSLVGVTVCRSSSSFHHFEGL